MSQPPAEGLSVLLPVFNQAGTIEQAVAAWSTLLSRLDRPYEFIVIDDGSTDATGKLLHGGDDHPGLAARVPHLRVLGHPERRGFGACLRDGLAAAQMPLVFYTGLDHAYNPADLRTLLERIAEEDPETGRKIDAVTGYRAGTPLTGWPKVRDRLKRMVLGVALGMQVPPRPGWLGAEEHRYSRRIRMLFGLRVGDVNSKFKLFRRAIFGRIPIQSDGDFVHAEILAKANFLGCLMDEVPVAEKPGPFPAHPEPPSPTPVGKELRHVFGNPDFGPKEVAAVTTPAPPTDAATPV
jgi:glycosyltransferase involved in cell wall biosynthesis